MYKIIQSNVSVNFVHLDCFVFTGMDSYLIGATLVIIATYFMVARAEVIDQTTQSNGNVTHNFTCQFEILNLESIKTQFEEFVLIDTANLVFFNIEINQEFLNITSYDNIHKNGILRWLWVADSQLYILSYPIDLDGITLRLTQSTERTVHLAVNATIDIQEYDESNYTICIQSLYQTIFDNILDRNQTNWKFCHRYFEGQYWKKILYFMMGSWLGYDLQCFNVVCANTECSDIVTKGTVNIVIDICILLLCLNLPLFYLFLPRRQVISENQVMRYYKGESPYSFARLFLHLNKKTETSNVHERQQRKTCSEWFSKVLDDVNDLEPEAKILSFLGFITIGIYILENEYLRQAIADFDEYTEIYQPDSLFLKLSIEGKYSSVVVFAMTFIFVFPGLLAYMSYYGQSKNTFISLNPFGIINFDNIVKQQNNYMKFTGYTQFAMKFLNRISFFFKKELWVQTLSLPCSLRKFPCFIQYCIGVPFLLVVTPLNLIFYTLSLLLPMCHFIVDYVLLCPVKLMIFFLERSNEPFDCFTSVFVGFLFMGINIGYVFFAFRPYFLFVVQFAFRLIVYTIFVAGPLFSISTISYHYWAISLAALAYILKYTITFHSNYKYLLTEIIKLKRCLKGEAKNDTDDFTYDISATYSRKIIHDFRDNGQQIQNLDERRNEEDASIPVDLFDQIASEFVPLNVQVLNLFLKVFFTGLFLYVSFDSMSNGGKDNFLTSQIPVIITVVMPAIAERLCSTSNIKDDVKMNEDAIKYIIANYKRNSDDKTVDTSTKEQSSGMLDQIKRACLVNFVIFCPIIFTVKSILTSPLICFSKKTEVIDVEYCPEDMRFCLCSCCCANDEQDENDERIPFNGSGDEKTYNSTARVITQQPF